MIRVYVTKVEGDTEEFEGFSTVDRLLHVTALAFGKHGYVKRNGVFLSGDVSLQNGDQLQWFPPAAAADDLVMSLIKDFTAMSFMKTFTYSRSRASEPRSTEFKCKLRKRTGNPATGDITCQLTELTLPSKYVTGAHIFKREWASYAQPLMKMDVDDPRNGLLLLGVLEELFDDSRWCFVLSRGDDGGQLVMRLLDAEYRNIKLIELVKGQDHDLEKLRQVLGNRTVGDYEGSPLHFKAGNGPFRRCLAFHAKRALQRASNDKFLRADYDPATDDYDYYSEGVPICMFQNVINVEGWRRGASSAVPPEEPPEDVVEEVDEELYKELSEKLSEDSSLVS